MAAPPGQEAFMVAAAWHGGGKSAVWVGRTRHWEVSGHRRKLSSFYCSFEADCYDPCHEQFGWGWTPGHVFSVRIAWLGWASTHFVPGRWSRLYRWVWNNQMVFRNRQKPRMWPRCTEASAETPRTRLTHVSRSCWVSVPRGRVLLCSPTSGRLLGP